MQTYSISTRYSKGKEECLLCEEDVNENAFVLALSIHLKIIFGLRKSETYEVHPGCAMKFALEISKAAGET